MDAEAGAQSERMLLPSLSAKCFIPAKCAPGWNRNASSLFTRGRNCQWQEDPNRKPYKEGILGFWGRKAESSREWKENHPPGLDTTLLWNEILLLPDTPRTVGCGADGRGGVSIREQRRLMCSAWASLGRWAVRETQGGAEALPPVPPSPLTPLPLSPELGTPQCLQFWVTEGTGLSSINCPICLNEADSAAWKEACFWNNPRVWQSPTEQREPGAMGALFAVVLLQSGGLSGGHERRNWRWELSPSTQRPVSLLFLTHRREKLTRHQSHLPALEWKGRHLRKRGWRRQGQRLLASSLLGARVTTSLGSQGLQHHP